MLYLCVMEDNKNLMKSQDNPSLPTQLVDDVKLIVERGLREAYEGANSVFRQDLLERWQTYC